MLGWAALCLFFGLGLSLRFNVIVLTIIALIGGAGAFAISMLLGAGVVASISSVVILIISIEAGYFLGLLTQTVGRE